MGWPIEGDYFEAVQNPVTAFSDPELKTGRVTLTPLGLPKPITGAFASVYEVNCNGRRWAVRCFLREFADQQRRYSAINDHLRTAQIPATVQFQFLSQGIRVRGQWYPILKMEWIDGVPLNAYVAASLHQPAKLQSLARQWVDLMAALKRAAIAHGDLQHGNVLVCNDQLRLIDYDGMYVPALAGLRSHEEGHRNYQHPARTGNDFDLHIDNFSAWVIFLSISALALEPRIWSMTGSGDEALLFRREDFREPYRSKAFQILEATRRSELQALVTHFRSLLSLPLRQIPGLDGVSLPSPKPEALSGVPSSSRPEWLDDHVPRQSQPEGQPEAPNVTQESGSRVFGADWLIDHLVNPQPVTPIWQSVPVTFERLALLVTTVVVSCIVLAAIVSALPVFLATIMAGSVLMALGALLYARYSAIVSSAGRAIAVSRLRMALDALSRMEVEMRVVHGERTRLDEPLIRLDRELRGLPTAKDIEERAARHSLDDKLTAIDAQRALLDKNESQAISDVEAKWSTVLGPLILQRNSLDADQQKHLNDALNQAREQHVNQHLSQARIFFANLHGIGPKLVQRLAARGVRSAADVTEWSIQVGGIGEAKGATLLEWKRDIVASAMSSAPTSPSQNEIHLITSHFRQVRSSLDGRIDTAQRQQREEMQSVLGRCGSQRQSLAVEETRLKTEFQQFVERLEAKYKREHARLTAEATVAKPRRAAARRPLDLKLGELQRSIYQERLNVHQAQRELDRYKGVSFVRFILRVVRYRRPN